jgi:ubiquinone biosynthesis protein
VPALALGGRLVCLSAVLLVTAVRLLGCWLVAVVRRRRAAFPDAAWAIGVQQIHRAGPTAVKVAQLLSTRLDLLPERVCRALSTLHDDAPPLRARVAERIATERLGAPLETLFRAFAPVPEASGSIACVHRAELVDGTVVAVKLRRPGIEATVAADLRLFRLGASMIADTRLMRGLPTRAAVAQLSSAIADQLDFTREAAALSSVADAVSEFAYVRVPRPHPDLADPARTGAGVLVMEFVPGLARRTPADLGVAASARAVESSLDAVYKMLFVDGLVHCDLHPGNLYLFPDGSVCVLDAGFVVALPPAAQRAFTEFFFRMGTGNEERCADLVLSTVEQPAGFDDAGFRRELGALVRSVTGSRADQFELLGFAVRLFDIQRRFGLYADPQFVFPLLGLLVLEGAIKEYHPTTDFQGLAVPHLMRAMFAPQHPERLLIRH